MKLTLAALLVAGAAFAQTTTKEAPPPAGPAKPFTLPAVTKFDLPNGLRVRLVQYGSVPKATVQLSIQTGNFDESASESWLANVTDDMLQQGTTTRSAEQIARDMASMGSDLSANTGRNDVTFDADVFSESAPKLVALLGDMMQHPLFPAAELPRIKQDRIRDLALQRARPQRLAAEKFMGALFPGSPYARYFPTDALLQGYTLDQVKSFFDRNYGAARARIYVVGRFDPVAVESAIRSSFGSWRRGNPPSVPQVTSVAKRVVYLIDRPGAVQTTLYVGLPAMEAPNPDYTSFVVMDALLGGTFGSRITSNIREQKGYTYSPGSQIDVSRLGAGSWFEAADVTTKDTGASIHEILGEIDRLRSTPPPADELLAIERNEAGIFVLRNSERSAIANLLAFVDLHGLGEDYLRNYVQRVYAVTPADVQRAAQLIDPSKITIIAVGDKKVILDQLKAYGDVVE
jgi:predicted Zn-dependent peptidase